MIEFNLQFFGGRGSSSDGPSLSGGGGGNVDFSDEIDVWSYRHNPNNAPFVDEINEGVRAIQNDFPDIMDTTQYVQAAKFSAKDMNVLGCYGSGRLTMNERYTKVEKMNTVYDQSVKSKYHPPRGDKTGVQAVAIHEMGHALTDHIGKKAGTGDIDATSKVIVDRAYKKVNGRGGTKSWAGKISGYAQTNYAECVAEAVTDAYCNGKNARKESLAIVDVMKQMYKG